MNTEQDNVNPSHYANFKVSPIDLIESYKMDFLTGNVVKYTARAEHKNGDEDLRKALWYLMRKLGCPKSRIQEITDESKGWHGNPEGDNS